MRTIRTIAEMRAWLGNVRAEGRSVGLVPTMGAFHAGHHSLMRAAREEQDSVVVSLFVNPAQFNDSRDLAAYPRTEANDAAEAADLGVDVLFAPPASEIYPDGLRHDGPGRRPRRGARGRRARARALRRRLHRRQQAAQHRRARRRVLRPEGRAAGRGGQADGARPRHAGADRGRCRPCASPTGSRSPRATSASPRRPRPRSRALAGAARRRGRRRRRRARRRTRSARPPWPRLGDVDAEYLAIVDPLTFTPLRTIVAPALVAIAAQVGPVRLIDNIVLEPVRPVATG